MWKSTINGHDAGSHLLDRHVALIVTTRFPAILAAMVTSTIPVVFHNGR